MSARTTQQEISHQRSGNRGPLRTFQRQAAKKRAVQFSKMSPRLQRSIMKYGAL